MAWADLIFRQTMHGYVSWLVVFAILTVVELRFARDRRQPLAGRVAGLLFWAMWIPISAVATNLLTAFWASVGVRPLMSLPLLEGLAWAGPASAVLAVLLAAFVADFFAYWYHRLQHGWLWRYHAVHHSIRELNAVNSFHHVTEVPFNLLIMTVPVSLIAVDPGPAIPLMTMLLWVQIVFLHSPTRMHLGPLRALFSDNRFHRIHHSLQAKHFDKNFGAFTTLWDRLFGTAHFPAHDEWPDVGLSDIDQPRTVREWFDLPLRYGREGSEPIAASNLSSVGHSDPACLRGTASSA